MTKEQRALYDAMTQARRRHQVIPCELAPDLFTSDIIGPRQAKKLIARCHTCPVLTECDANRKALEADGKKLYGIVAGVHIRHPKTSPHPADPTSRRDLRLRAKGMVGDIPITQARAWARNGWTHTRIAARAGVSPDAVWLALKRAGAHAGPHAGAHA